MATTVSLDDIQGLYIAYFNRPADYKGLLFWQTAANNAGGDINAVANAFAASPEYTATFTGKTSLEIVDQIYVNLFGRHAELDGLNFWSSALDNKVLGVGNIAYQIMKGAQNADLAAVQSKISAATQFYNALDTSAEVIGYTGAAANQVARTWLAGITDDATLAAATTTAALNAVTAAVVAAHDAVSNVGTTYTLTSGVDIVVGGSGNDVFNATPSSTGAATFTALDSIDGGAGNNTLNIVDTVAAGTAFAIAPSATVKNVQTVNITSANNTVSGDTSGWTGVTSLKVGSVGGATLTAAGTTAVNVTDTALGASHSISVNGGSSVTVTAAGATAGSTITVGGTTAPTGAVVINETAAIAGGSAAGLISVTGGTTVSVTETGSNSTTAVPGTATTATQSAVNVTGTAATTAVTVNQSAAVAAVAGTAGVAQVDTITIGGTPGTGDILTATVNGVVYSVTLTAGQAASVTTAAAALAAAITAPGITVSGAAAGAFTLTAATAGTAFTATTGVTVVGGTATTNTDVHSTPNTAIVAGTSGLAAGAVTIADANAGSTTKAATIASVTLANYGNSTISSNALANLSLTGTGGTLGLTSGLTTETVKKLNLTVNGLSGANTITDSSNHFTTIAVTTATKDSTIANIVDSAATALTVAGSNALTLTSVGGLSNLATVTVSGAASLVANVSALASLTDVNAAASSGANNLTLGTATTYEGGSGVDTVKLTGAATVKIDGGAGSADVINLAGAAGTLLTAATGAKLVNFEVLDATGGTGSYDVSLLTGIKAVQVGVDGGSGVTFNNVAAGTSLSLLADAGHAVTYALKTDTATDSLQLNLGTAKTAGISFTGGVSVGAIETVNIVSNGTVTSGVSTGTNALALTDAAVTKLVVSGAESLTLTGLTGNTVTAVDATGVAKGATFTLTTAATATAGATVTAADGNLVFTGAAAATKVDTITAGHGNNTIVEGAGDNSITLGNGTNSVTVGNGNNTINLGTGQNTVTLGTGQNVVTVGAHGTNVDTITFGIATTANTYSTVTGLAKSDVLNFADHGTEVWLGGSATAAQIKLNTSTALFADYIQAAAAGNVTAGTFSWFQFNGNTYVVEDHSTSTSFVAGADNIVKLTGLVDLTKATLGDHIITLG